MRPRDGYLAFPCCFICNVRRRARRMLGKTHELMIQASCFVPSTYGYYILLY